PRRMLKGLLGRDVGEVLRALEERPARGREEETGDAVEGFADEALPDRGVLRIDRAQPRQGTPEWVRRVADDAVARKGTGDWHDEVTAGDHRLLVRRRDDPARTERGEDRPHADDAARADNDEVDVVPRRESLEGVRPTLNGS